MVVFDDCRMGFYYLGVRAVCGYKPMELHKTTKVYKIQQGWQWRAHWYPAGANVKDSQPLLIKGGWAGDEETAERYANNATPRNVDS